MTRTAFQIAYSAYDIACIRANMLWSTLRTRVCLALQACRAGKGFRSTGFIRIKARSAGSITLGEHVTLLAHWRSNRVGMNGPVILHTWEGGTISIGDHTGMSATAISSRAGVTIGRHCNIGGNVRIFDHDFHALDAEVRRGPRGCEDCARKPVSIGDDVFIGANSILLKGTRIGDRSIIGAGSVVSGIIPPDCVAAGNPAIVVRKLKEDNEQ